MGGFNWNKQGMHMHEAIVKKRTNESVAKEKLAISLFPVAQQLISFTTLTCMYRGMYTLARCYILCVGYA